MLFKYKLYVSFFLVSPPSNTSRWMVYNIVCMRNPNEEFAVSYNGLGCVANTRLFFSFKSRFTCRIFAKLVVGVRGNKVCRKTLNRSKVAYFMKRLEYKWTLKSHYLRAKAVVYTKFSPVYTCYKYTLDRHTRHTHNTYTCLHFYRIYMYRKYSKTGRPFLCLQGDSPSMPTTIFFL